MSSIDEHSNECLGFVKVESSIRILKGKILQNGGCITTVTSK